MKKLIKYEDIDSHLLSLKAELHKASAVDLHIYARSENGQKLERVSAHSILFFREFILMTKKRLQIDPWATDDLSFVFADLPMTSVKQMLRVVYNGTVNARSEKEMAEIQGLLKFFHFKTKEFKSDSEPDDVLQSGEIGPVKIFDNGKSWKCRSLKCKSRFTDVENYKNHAICHFKSMIWDAFNFTKKQNTCPKCKDIGEEFASSKELLRHMIFKHTKVWKKMDVPVPPMDTEGPNEVTDKESEMVEQQAEFVEYDGESTVGVSEALEEKRMKELVETQFNALTLKNELAFQETLDEKLKELTEQKTDQKPLTKKKIKRLIQSHIRDFGDDKVQELKENFDQKFEEISKLTSELKKPLSKKKIKSLMDIQFQELKEENNKVMDKMFEENFDMKFPEISKHLALDVMKQNDEHFEENSKKLIEELKRETNESFELSLHTKFKEFSNKIHFSNQNLLKEILDKKILEISQNSVGQSIPTDFLKEVKPKVLSEFQQDRDSKLKIIKDADVAVEKESKLVCNSPNLTESKKIQNFKQVEKEEAQRNDNIIISKIEKRKVREEIESPIPKKNKSNDTSFEDRKKPAEIRIYISKNDLTEPSTIEEDPKKSSIGETSITDVKSTEKSLVKNKDKQLRINETSTIENEDETTNDNLIEDLAMDVDEEVDGIPTKESNSITSKENKLEKPRIVQIPPIVEKQKNRFVCETCQMPCISLQNYKIHIMSHHQETAIKEFSLYSQMATNVLPKLCPICVTGNGQRAFFTSTRALIYHMMFTHMMEKIVPVHPQVTYEETPIAKPEAQTKANNFMENIHAPNTEKPKVELNAQENENKKKYCNICGLKFVACAKNHMATIHYKSEVEAWMKFDAKKSYKCEYCQKKIRFSYRTIGHMITDHFSVLPVELQNKINQTEDSNLVMANNPKIKILPKIEQVNYQNSEILNNVETNSRMGNFETQVSLPRVSNNYMQSIQQDVDQNHIVTSEPTHFLNESIIAKNANLEGEMIKCMICNEAFQVKTELMKHLVTDHKDRFLEHIKTKLEKTKHEESIIADEEETATDNISVFDMIVDTEENNFANIQELQQNSTEGNVQSVETGNQNISDVSEFQVTEDGTLSDSKLALKDIGNNNALTPTTDYTNNVAIEDFTTEVVANGEGATQRCNICSCLCTNPQLHKATTHFHKEFTTVFQIKPIQGTTTMYRCNYCPQAVQPDVYNTRTFFLHLISWHQNMIPVWLRRDLNSTKPLLSREKNTKQMIVTKLKEFSQTSDQNSDAATITLEKDQNSKGVTGGRIYQTRSQTDSNMKNQKNILIDDNSTPFAGICKICNLFQGDLGRHMAETHGQTELLDKFKQNKCQICVQSFKEKKLLMYHMINTHKNMISREWSDRVLQNENIGNKIQDPLNFTVC